MIAPFYSLRFDEKKALQDYVRSLDKAQFSRARQVQIDIDILKKNFFNELLKELHQRGLTWSLKASGSSLQQVEPQALQDMSCQQIHLFFSHTSQIEDYVENPNSIGIPIVFIVEPDLKTDLQYISKIFPKADNLYFVFSPHNPSDIHSMTVSEIQKGIRQLLQKSPEFKIQVFPFYEAIDYRIPNNTELEPNNIHPLFSFGKKDDFDFSFIIPTFNSKYFLLNVVKHLLSLETKYSYEILIVDDGGTDESASILHSYLKNETSDFNLKYFYWPKPDNKPLDFFRAGLCRNLGAGNSKGRRLVFLDSDILVPKNFLEDLANQFKEADVVQYVRRHILPEKSNSHVEQANLNLDQDTYIEESHYWKPFFTADSWISMPFFWKYTCTYCLAVRADDFFSVGRFKRTFVSYGFEDTDLGYRLANQGLRFKLSKLATLHLTHENAKHSGSGATFRRHMALSKTAKKFFLHTLDPDIYRHFIIYMGGENTVLRRYKKIKLLFRKHFQRSKEF